MASNLDRDEISSTYSDATPNHYVAKIQLFSQLLHNSIDKYATSEFEAGGYNWKLVIHPNGNKSKGITDHISLYLVMVEGKSLSLGWEIRAAFRLFLLDQNKDRYLILEDAAEKGSRFHGMKLERGFDNFIAHSTFKDPTNGYLVDDTCVFGAEVYVHQEKCKGKGECLSMVKEAISYKNTWRIENYSSLTEECVDSNIFNAVNQKWKMQIYPKGKGTGAGSHISMYLTLAEPANLSQESKIYAEFTLRILDQISGQHYFGKASYWFSTSNPICGWPRFVSHGYFNISSRGLLMKNVCLVDAEVTVHGMANTLSA